MFRGYYLYLIFKKKKTNATLTVPTHDLNEGKSGLHKYVQAISSIEITKKDTFVLISWNYRRTYILSLKSHPQEN